MTDASGSRLHRMLYSDGLRGRWWFQWAVLSHGLLVFAPIGLVGAVLDGDSEDYGWLGGMTFAAVVSTVLFWVLARRVWRRLPDAVDPVPPARQAAPGTETVRRLS